MANHGLITVACFQTFCILTFSYPGISYPRRL